MPEVWCGVARAGVRGDDQQFQAHEFPLKCVDELVKLKGEAHDLAICLIATISVPVTMLAVSMVTMVCD